MRIPDIPMVYKIGGGVLLAFGLYVVLRGVKGVASDVAGGVVDAGVGAVEGATLSIGDALGVPRTELTACEQAKLDGDAFAVSKACPAGDFLSWWVAK